MSTCQIESCTNESDRTLGKSRITEALKEETPGGLTKKEHLVNIVYEELVKFLGDEKVSLNTSKKPTKIMF